MGTQERQQHSASARRDIHSFSIAVIVLWFAKVQKPMVIYARLQGWNINRVHIWIDSFSTFPWRQLSSRQGKTLYIDGKWLRNRITLHDVRDLIKIYLSYHYLNIRHGIDVFVHNFKIHGTMTSYFIGKGNWNWNSAQIPLIHNFSIYWNIKLLPVILLYRGFSHRIFAVVSGETRPCATNLSH